jgi:hypothetical protein
MTRRYRRRIDLPFNKDGMAVRDLVTVADSFDSLLREFESLKKGEGCEDMDFPDKAEMLWDWVALTAEGYTRRSK